MRSTRWNIVATVGVLMLALLAGPVEADQRPPKAAATVRAEKGAAPLLWEWSPTDVTITKNQRVRWENPTGTPHDVLVWDGPSDLHTRLAPGDAHTLRFEQRGVYRYRCAISEHSDVVFVGTERTCVGMCGVVTVE